MGSSNSFDFLYNFKLWKPSFREMATHALEKDIQLNLLMNAITKKTNKQNKIIYLNSV